LEAIRQLPEDSTLAEIMDAVQIATAVRQGREDIKAGRSKTQAEVEGTFESWANQWGKKTASSS